MVVNFGFNSSVAFGQVVEFGGNDSMVVAVLFAVFLDQGDENSEPSGQDRYLDCFRRDHAGSSPGPGLSGVHPESSNAWYSSGVISRTSLSIWMLG